jgi:hypothetical protein
MPATSIRDLVIKDNDLVVATHGRSFWILDDITPLYQLNENISKSALWLYKPRDSYRLPGGYIEDPNVQEGENAPNGVAIRYYLKTKPLQEIKLKFYSAAGDSIITYSNLKDNKGEPAKISKDYYESKAKRPGFLSIDSGMNQFVWDLRYPAAKADTSATFEGSLAGPLVVPGTYQVKLFVGDSLVQTQPFNILNDPRNNFTIADLKEQFDLGIKIHNKLNEVAKRTKQIGLVRDQLNAFVNAIEDSTEAKPFKNSSKLIIDSLTSVEDALHNSKIKAGEDDLRFPMRLEEKLGALNGSVLGSDSKPTASMTESYSSLAARIDVQLQKLNVIIDTQIPPFNEAAKSRQKGAIDTKVKN